MIYAFIICLLAVVIIGGYMFFKTKKDKTKILNIEFEGKPKAELAVCKNNEGNLVVKAEALPAEIFHDEDKLVEITDHEVLARIDNLVPGLAQAGVAANNAVQAVNAGGEVLYRAILPAGAKLADSKAMEGAVRGMYMEAGKIKGNANFVAVQAQNSGMAAVNVASAAMGVASMVVGQYYMSKITDELNVISDGLSEISDFQNNEYRSKVFALIEEIKVVSKFRSEIAENDDLRKERLSKLGDWEHECIELLGQANLAIADYAKKNNLDYAGYEKNLHEAQSWFVYQQYLLEVLQRISELKYSLYFGEVSREQCSALIPTYTKQVKDSRDRLIQWHDVNAERLGIDLDEELRKRNGFDMVLHFIPGLFDGKNKYKAIDKNTVGQIEMQKADPESLYQKDDTVLYDKEAQLIAKDGKIYYLPSA